MTVSPGRNTTKLRNSSKVGVSRPLMDRIRSPGWICGRRRRALSLNCTDDGGELGAPNEAKKAAKIAIASRKLETGPASTIRNRCHTGL